MLIRCSVSPIYSNSNSGLSSDGISAICIDNTNTKWIASHGLIIFNENGIPNSKIENTICRNGLKLFPNPVNNYLHIELKPIINDSYIEIFNIHGNQVKKKLISTINTSFDVSSLPSGVYILKVISKEGIQSKKFVKD